MNPIVVVPLVLVGAVGLAVVLIVLAGRQTGRAFQLARRLAGDLGLTIMEATPKLGLFWPPPRAAGEIRGRRAELFGFSTGSGKSRVQWCALALRPTARSNLTFRLVRQGLGTRLSRFLGAREITVGDPAFDAAWFIQTNQPDYLTAALLPEVCSRLLTAVADGAHLARSATFKLEDNQIIYAETGDFGAAARCERLRRVADVLVDFAAIAEVYAQSQVNE